MICKCGNEFKTTNGAKQCKQCTAKKRAEYMKKYREQNRERLNQYQREWAAERRWLNGGPDNYMLGPDIPVSLRSWDGELKI
jgi:hypothetical protein